MVKAFGFELLINDEVIEDMVNFLHQGLLVVIN
jgi:hypothetical protein